MTMNATRLPALPAAFLDLAILPRWVGWKWERRDGRLTKVPKTRGNRNASTSTPSCWVTHEEACLWSQCDGVGFVLSGVQAKDLVAMDFDHVRDKETGKLLPWAEKAVAACASYTEVTPSGNGLRIVGFAPGVIGTIDRRVKHPEGGSFELYACPQARFITVTGERLAGTPDRRADVSKPFLELLSLAAETRDVPASNHATVFAPATDISPDELDVETYTLISNVYEGEDRSATFLRVVGNLKGLGYGPSSITRLMEKFPHGPGVQKYGRRLHQEVVRAWMKATDGPPLIEEEPAAEPLPPHDPETGEIVDEPLPPDAVNAELPDHLTRPGGMLGEIVDWIFATSRRPNRILALGAAITVMGTIVGRRTLGPTRSGTHLYVVALAPSGAGKDHPLRQAGRILRAVSHDLVGPDEFISMPAFVNFASRKPLALVLMDEIGAWFKRLGDHRASSYEKALSKSLRTFWGVSGDFVSTPEWAGKESVEIFAPSLSIFGVSTPDEFFEAIQGGDVVNGFLNRFLLLPAAGGVADRDPQADPQQVPRALAERMVRVHRALQTLTDAEMRAPVGAPHAMRVVGWGPDAQPVYEALKGEVMRLLVRYPDREPYYARTTEMAVRMATVAALGHDIVNPQVSRADMCWAAELALWAAERMAKMASGYIAENETQRLSNRILRTLEKRDWTMTHRDLLRSLGGAVRSRDLAEVMKTLIESGYIEAVRSIPKSGGPATIRYRKPA